MIIINLLSQCYYSHLYIIYPTLMCRYLFPTYENDGLLCVLDEEELQNMIH